MQYVQDCVSRNEYVKSKQFRELATDISKQTNNEPHDSILSQRHHANGGQREEMPRRQVHDQQDGEGVSTDSVMKVDRASTPWVHTYKWEVTFA